MTYCIFLYSHDDYSDIWPLTFGQLYKYIDLNKVDIYFCVNKLNNYKIDDRIKIMYYDDKQIYTDRILFNIVKINYDYILFLHEDWVITNTYNNDYILNLINFMDNNKIMHIRSYKNYGSSNSKPEIFLTNNEKNINICNIPNNSSNFISLQPGLWNINILIELYKIKSNKPNILENNSNKFFRLKYNNKFFYEFKSTIAQDSIMFPHIHTVAYGKWAMNNDSYNVLDSLFKLYNIDKNKRGFN